tara:strand:- start:5463 stop:5942 length:480 start_codon:yes stop_codon:yes gene_type:complete
MKTFQQFSEAFDTKVKWKTIEKQVEDDAEYYLYETRIDDRNITLIYTLDKENDGSFNCGVVFRTGSAKPGVGSGTTIAVTGEGSQMKILGAVINHMKEFIKKRKDISIVEFSADKGRDGSSTSRTSLYKRLVKRFANTLGFSLEIESQRNMDTFILTRK